MTLTEEAHGYCKEEPLSKTYNRPWDAEAGRLRPGLGKLVAEKGADQRGHSSGLLRGPWLSGWSGDPDTQAHLTEWKEEAQISPRSGGPWVPRSVGQIPGPFSNWVPSRVPGTAGGPVMLWAPGNLLALGRGGWWQLQLEGGDTGVTRTYNVL